MSKKRKVLNLKSEMPNKRFTVAVLGAAGGIGQPLSLLLKMDPYVSNLRLYDVVKSTPGVAKDLSHIPTDTTVEGFWDPPTKSGVPQPQLVKALRGADLVLIPAGVPRRPGMSRDDVFDINSKIMATLCFGIARACPKALVLIIANPVNSNVPLAARIMQRLGIFDSRKLFGVTTLDRSRTKSFIADHFGGRVNPADVDVPIIGGHSGTTIFPLLSRLPSLSSSNLEDDENKQKVSMGGEEKGATSGLKSGGPSETGMSMSDVEVKALTKRIQTAGTEVVVAKAGAGSATLSMAHAGARFARSCLMSLAGEKGIVESAYVASDLMPGLKYFSSPLLLGPHGVDKILKLGPLSPYEKMLLDADVIPGLRSSIEKGTNFASSVTIPAMSPALMPLGKGVADKGTK